MLKIAEINPKEPPRIIGDSTWIIEADCFLFLALTVLIGEIGADNILIK